jgi:Holliday junction resolvasome RuvABC DNA-binding subunit
MIGVALFGAVVGAVLARRLQRGQAANRDCDPPSRIDPTSPRVGPATAGIEDAQAALVGLGYKARDARKSIVSAIATLDADADVAAIIKAARRDLR